MKEVILENIRFDKRGDTIRLRKRVLEDMAYRQSAKRYGTRMCTYTWRCSARTASTSGRGVSGCCPAGASIGPQTGSPFTRATRRFECTSGGQHRQTGPVPDRSGPWLSALNLGCVGPQPALAGPGLRPLYGRVRLFGGSRKPIRSISSSWRAR
jgi:hypothetical protein